MQFSIEPKEMIIYVDGTPVDRSRIEISYASPEVAADTDVWGLYARNTDCMVDWLCDCKDKKTAELLETALAFFSALYPMPRDNVQAMFKAMSEALNVHN